jgi:hypothetical protein
MAENVVNLRSNTRTYDNSKIVSDSHYFDFVYVNLNLTYARLVNCTENPTFCALCRIVNCTLDLRIGKPIFATDSFYSAIKVSVNNENHVMVTR